MPMTLRQELKLIKADIQGIGIRKLLALPVTLPLDLKKFFSERIPLEQSEERIKQALGTREERFLALCKAEIYDRPQSPYLKLMQHAGCGFPDLEEHTRRHGLESSLKKIASEGVYLTAAEFKGKKEVVRGTLRFRMTPQDVALQHSGPGLVTRSSGTSNEPLSSLASLDWLAHDAATVGVFLSAHKLGRHSHAVYEPILPGVGGIMFMKMVAKLGLSCDRWFARSVPFNSWMEKTYAALIARELSWTGTRFGPGFSRPLYIERNNLRPIVRWVGEMRDHGRQTCIRTVASSAVRIAQAAEDMGESLENLTFISTGEPMTKAKYGVITRSGAKTTVAYGYDPGTVHVGFGCANPVHVDEMHANLNTLGIIAHPFPASHKGEQINPLLFTTLYDSAAFFQLNVENGDYAVMEERDCGCGLQKAGLSLHIHRVRSYEKFTSEGLSYPVWALVEFLETTLPSEFGGGIGDYQLLEEQSDSGQTFLTLLVHPHVGTLDEKQLLLRLQDKLAEGQKGHRFMTQVWKDSGTFRVRREPPVESLRGKVLPIQPSFKKTARH